MNGWLEAMKSPLSLVFHAALLVAVLYHTYTWFKIMPMTLPPILIGGKKVGDCAITVTGWSAAVVASVGLLALLWRIA